MTAVILVGGKDKSGTNTQETIELKGTEVVQTKRVLYPPKRVYTMSVLHEYPPMIKEINKVFHVIGKPILYTCGNTIYNPMRIDITPGLFAHENTHAVQQANWNLGIEHWWESYIVSTLFRLHQEIPAHAAEYKFVTDSNPNRKVRRANMKVIAKRLAGPLYGNKLSVNQAIKLIRAELKGTPNATCT